MSKFSLHKRHETRDSETRDGSLSLSKGPMFDRGYTGHEHMTAFDLINMNGRLYDPVLGRMLSPDIAIQDLYNQQAYNRYSYCLNNPLRFTDPSGYFVTIPPEYFEIEEYIKSNDVESLRQLGITNYYSNTELSEGKMVTTTTWTCDGQDVKMITRSQEFPFYEQHFSKSCLAVSVVAQELSNGANFNNLMSIINEITNMVLFQPNAFEKGLNGDDFLNKYTHGFSCSFSSYRSHQASSVFDNKLEYLFSEFDKGNGIGFTVKNDNWIGNHFVNMYSYSKLYENDSYQDYKIKVWDSDFYNPGAHGGIKYLDDYQKLLKISILIK